MSRATARRSLGSGHSTIVIGGGLAGIAAATALASTGIRVTLVEARHALGGRATSFIDAATAEELDNCQHVLLGCCTNLLDLYGRLGVSHLIDFHSSVHFLDSTGRRHTLTGNALLPAPLHLGASMARFSLLTVAERLAVVRAMTAMLQVSRAGRNRLDSISFGAFLKPYDQPPGLYQKFYDPVLISALNEHSQDASAKYAIMVFQDAMLAHRRGHLVGLPRCPLGQLYAHLPANITLRLNARVEEIVFDRSLATGVRLRSGEVLAADSIILATNHHATAHLIPADLAAADTRFANVDKLVSVPILGVHLWFDTPILDVPAVALTSGPLHWLFRKDATGRAVHGVISAARDWPSVPKDAALAQFTQQIRAQFPHAKGAKLLRSLIVIEKRATFSPLPGHDAYRPQQAPPAGGLSNVYLAGDYTQTHWPATMEGATRSGYLAAQALTGKTFLRPDLLPEWPARLMGL